MNGAYRCSGCATDWPHRSEYSPCPSCGEAVWYDSKGSPMDEDEAKSRKNHADFERWLDANNRRDTVELLERQLTEAPAVDGPSGRSLAP